MTKQAYGAVIAKVRALCARPDGASLKETCEALEKSQNFASVYITALVKSGEIVRVGPLREYRYFKDKEKAAAYDLIAQEERAKQTIENKKRKNERKAERERNRRSKLRQERERLTKPAGIKNPLKRKMPQNIVIQSTQQAKDQIRQHKAATIIWPEHVKVQHIPVPEDTRFKPEPGYKGSFLQEWQDRRAA